LLGLPPWPFENSARRRPQGKPFAGPARNLLNKALAEAGIDRTKVYVTNVVKHFKWEPRGKRRIHKKPNAAEITACRPWLEAEIRVVQPQVIICLGSTARKWRASSGT
jgi:uracil-DNA glycosylase family 4